MQGYKKENVLTILSVHVIVDHIFLRFDYDYGGYLMAVPRAKTSKARTRRRRGINMRLTAPHLVECANCGNLILSHHACSKCGHYRGRQVVDPDTLN